MRFTGSLCTTTCHGTSSSSSPLVSFSRTGVSTADVDLSCTALTALMKKMLSHCRLDSNLRLRQNFALSFVHLPGAGLVSIIEAMQMEQTVDYVQPQCVCERVSKSSRVTNGGVGADKNFAMLKCDHICGPGFIHELSMQRRHLSIGDDQHGNFAQLSEIRVSIFSRPKAGFYCFRGKLLKINNVH